MRKPHVIVDERDEELARVLQSYNDDIDVRGGARRRRIKFRYVPAGFIFGVVLIIPSVFVEVTHATRFSTIAWKTFTETLMHVGVGFIVASLAVLAYEWGSETKNALLLGWGLRRILTAQGREAVVNGLKVTLPGDEILRNEIIALVDYAAALRQHGDWGKTAYLDFLTALAGIITQTTRNLSSLGTAATLEPNADNPISLRLPEPGTLADSMLCGLLGKLESGDDYYAVSNARIWPILPKFHDAHIPAIRRGVNIRRIFVVFDPSDTVLTANDTVKIIYGNFIDSKTWSSIYTRAVRLFKRRLTPGYQMKIMTRATYRQLAPELEKLLHFGVFRRKSDTSLVFDVKSDDLSSFEVSHLARGSTFENFDQLWKDLPRVTGAVLQEQLRLERVRHLSAKSSYWAVTLLSDVKNPAWLSTECQLVEKARSGGVMVRRLLWADARHPASELESTKADVFATLGLDVAPQGYEWRLLSPGDRDRQHARFPNRSFAIFCEYGSDSPLALTEVSSWDSEFIFKSARALDLLSEFDRVWTALTPRCSGKE